MMAEAGRNNNMLSNRISTGDEDTESGRVTEQNTNIIRNLLPVDETLAEMEVVGDNDGHAEDIEKWVASLERILKDVPLYMCRQGHPGRISRIPENLREVDMKGYEPYILSIGPYHHAKPKVQLMEMKKKLVLKCVLENKSELTLKDYLTEVLHMEPTARSFYSDVEMDSENFVKMLLLDSVYIITMFFGVARNQERINEINPTHENGDANFGDREISEEETADDNQNLYTTVRVEESNDAVGTGENWYWALLTHDLLLIENQIPFFVLQKMHNLLFGQSGTQFLDMMKLQVGNMLTDYTKKDSTTVILQTEEVHHLLHLGHMFFAPTIQQKSMGYYPRESSQMFRLGSAMQLYEAGVHFEARSDSMDYSLIDITFDSHGKMTAPCLHVDDNTESLLRNLIALEQMKYPSLGLNISAYIVLLLHLITIPKDVELLRRKGLIQHHLASDKEMMYLINRLSIGLAFDYVEDEYSLKRVFHDLKRYTERRVPRWRAWIKHRHFSNPWTAISLLVASLLLLLTVVQTYYAVYSYYYPYLNGHS